MYDSLRCVLDEAFNQAAFGKGEERHGNGLPFEEQPMQVISDLLDSDAGMLFQAIKKLQEGSRMGPAAARRAQLGLNRPCFIHYIVATSTVDELVRARLDSKKSVQEILIEAMKRRA